MNNFTLSGRRKNKAKLTQYLMERRLFAYGARDCHGFSGLAMTFVSLLLCAPSTEFILSRVERTQGTLFEKKRDLKKQSQFLSI